MEAKIGQFGRSMVEMLGVLAIIGVLSVGAIAGYQKAMSKYKLNKASDQISAITTNIYTAFVNEKDYSALGHDPIAGTANAIKLKLLPEDMYNADQTTVHNVYGGEVRIYSVPYAHMDHGAFKLEYNNIPQEAILFFSTSESNVGNSMIMNFEINPTYE